MFTSVQREGVLLVGVNIDQQRFARFRRPQRDGEFVAVEVHAFGGIQHEDGRGRVHGTGLWADQAEHRCGRRDRDGSSGRYGFVDAVVNAQRKFVLSSA